MGQMVITGVPADLEARLRRRAELSGRSIEAETLDLLSRVEATLPPLPTNQPFTLDLARKLADVGLTKDDWDALDNSLDIVRRSRGDSIHRTVDFNDPAFDP